MIEFSEEHRMVREMVRDCARKEMAPIAIEIDENQRFAEETFKKMAGLHLLGLPISADYGGAGMDYISFVIALEELARVCASTALSYSAHISLASTPIELFGTEQQKQKYRKRLLQLQKTLESTAEWLQPEELSQLESIKERITPFANTPPFHT